MQFNDYIDSLLEQYDESYSHRIRKKYKNPALALGQAEQGEKVGKDGKSIPKHEEDKVSDKEYKAPTSEEEEGKEKGLDGKACWDGYKLQGTKKKGGKTVDNCVKIEDAEDMPADKVDEFHRALDELVHKYLGHSSDEAPEEDAEKVDKDRMKCNSPRRTSGGSKKFVVKACKDGKEKIVRFGDPNMKIKKSNPKRRKSFRARHKCDQKKDKFSAGYWSCKKW